MVAQLFSRKSRVVNAVQYSGTPESWTEVSAHVAGVANPLSKHEIKAFYSEVRARTARVQKSGIGHADVALRVRNTIKLVTPGDWVYAAEGTVYVVRDDYIQTHFDKVV